MIGLFTSRALRADHVLGETFFVIGRKADAISLILKHHYTESAPHHIIIATTEHKEGGLWRDHGPTIAACVFGLPGSKWSEDKIIELQRVVKDPEAKVDLSKLVLKTTTHIKDKNLADILIGYVDLERCPSERLIYEGAKWHYAGRRERTMVGVLINKKPVPGRTCNRLWGTRSPMELQKLKPNAKVEPWYDKGKMIYWLSLSKEGDAKAKRLGLERLPYPKA